MSTAEIDLALYFRKKHTPPPSVLLLSLPADVPVTGGGGKRHESPHELRSRQHKTRRQTPHIIGLHVKDVDIHDPNTPSHGWQRQTERTAAVNLAPDVAYKNTYLDESKREKSASISVGGLRSRSPSPRSQQSQQQFPRLKTAGSSLSMVTDSSQSQKRPSQQGPHSQYRTIYDYIRDSIRQIERQRNMKQHNFATRVKRPQNDDVILRRVLADKKTSAASVSRSSLTTATTMSTLFNNELRSPQSFVNYINHSREQVRVLHTTTPNRLYQQEESRRQRNVISHNGDSLERQQLPVMMTAGAGNS